MYKEFLEISVNRLRPELFSSISFDCIYNLDKYIQFDYLYIRNYFSWDHLWITGSTNNLIFHDRKNVKQGDKILTLRLHNPVSKASLFFQREEKKGEDIDMTNES